MERPLLIGIYPDAQNGPEWGAIKEFLQPAADRGGVEIERGPGWTVWTVHKGNMLVAAANVRRTTEKVVEVVLIGGRDHGEWLLSLDRKIGQWAKDEGATVMRAFGRPGWKKVLGWKVIGMIDNMVGYERAL